jgi:hypothetical protein
MKPGLFVSAALMTAHAVTRGGLRRSSHSRMAATTAMTMPTMRWSLAAVTLVETYVASFTRKGRCLSPSGSAEAP